MNGSMLDLADRLWRGEVSIEDHHPFAPRAEVVEVADSTAFVPSFANVTAFSAGEGLVLVDTGSLPLAGVVHGLVRSWSEDPVEVAVYTHGHIDHVMGVDAFEQAQGRKIKVIAHEAVARRFDRYRLTARFNEIVNRRQFGFTDLRWPTEYRYPDEVFASEFSFDSGGLAFELHHARGETDDHVWVWVPERKVLCCGDFFIWATPNAGNPQKVQRYAPEWAAALREMAELGAEVMLPGHGLPIAGADRVRATCSDTAELLESLHDQTVAMMNEGASLDDVIHEVKAPAHLIEKPYLRPIYDEPEFIVRNIWRLYGGWYDGNPANLKPSPASGLAAEIASLAGGAARLARRAAEVAAGGDLKLACHLAELAVRADPGDREAHSIRADVFERRADAEKSLMAKGIFNWAVSESRGKLQS
jgi:alkyl sulfatase BDS1-like metallo-beta-lactamase superfamily hydrolase